MKQIVMAMGLMGTCLLLAASATAQTAGLPEGWQAAGDWTALFDGTTLEAWQNGGGGAPSAGWTIEGADLVRGKKAGYIWTRERFGDFVLELEYNTKGNSGVFFRAANLKNVVQTGIEMQVNTHTTSGKNGVGAIYDLQAPSENAAKAGWNSVRLTAADNLINVVLNGVTIIDMDVNDWDTPRQNPDGRKNKFKTALRDFVREGHIGFQDHGAPVRYRNVRILRLERAAAEGE